MGAPSPHDTNGGLVRNNSYAEPRTCCKGRHGRRQTSRREGCCCCPFAKYLCLLLKAPSKSPNCILVSVSAKANSSSERFHIMSLTFHGDMCAEDPSLPIWEDSIRSVTSLMKGHAKQTWESARACVTASRCPSTQAEDFAQVFSHIN